MNKKLYFNINMLELEKEYPDADRSHFIRFRMIYFHKNVVQIEEKNLFYHVIFRSDDY